MLRPDEFYVGDLAGTAEPGSTLLLPRSHYEHAALLGVAHDQRVGVVLDGDLPGQAYPVRDDEPWRGLLIPNIRFEIDPSSAFDADEGLPIGSLVRKGDRVAIAAAAGPHYRISRPLEVMLASGLPAGEPHQGAGFRSWRIVVGSGPDLRILFTVETEDFQRRRSAALERG